MTIQKFTVIVEDTDGKQQAFRLSAGSLALALAQLRDLLPTGKIVSITKGWTS